MRLRRLCCYLVALAVFGCATEMAGQSSVPPFGTIVHYGEQIGFAPLSEETTEISQLELDLLPARAVVAHWIGRAPTPEVVLVNDSGRWRATLGDKDLLPGWKAAITPALKLSGEGLAHVTETEGAATRLASDLCSLLVDPDPSLGRVVSAIEEIPLQHPLSDVRRELERQEVPAEEVDRRLLAKSPEHIEAPQLRRISDDRFDLTFTTWNLHGGRLETWQVGLGKAPYVRVQLVARGTGSFRNFFF